MSGTTDTAKNDWDPRKTEDAHNEWTVEGRHRGEPTIEIEIECPEWSTHCVTRPPRTA